MVRNKLIIQTGKPDALITQRSHFVDFLLPVRCGIRQNKTVDSRFLNKAKLLRVLLITNYHGESTEV